MRRGWAVVVAACRLRMGYYAGHPNRKAVAVNPEPSVELLIEFHPKYVDREALSLTLMQIRALPERRVDGS
jgi:hypothetical protein